LQGLSSRQTTDYRRILRASRARDLEAGQLRLARPARRNGRLARQLETTTPVPVVIAPPRTRRGSKAAS